MTFSFDDDQLAAIGAAMQQHLADCRTTPFMTYAIKIGPWHVGPFPTAAHAQHWAERHGCDTWRLIQLDDPAEAPAVLASMKKARRSHGTGPDASAAVAA